MRVACGAPFLADPLACHFRCERRRGTFGGEFAHEDSDTCLGDSPFAGAPRCCPHLQVAVADPPAEGAVADTGGDDDVGGGVGDAGAGPVAAQLRGVMVAAQPAAVAGAFASVDGAGDVAGAGGGDVHRCGPLTFWWPVSCRLCRGGRWCVSGGRRS